MTEKELYKWIAEYTVSNNRYMKGGNKLWDRRAYDCYNKGIVFESDVRSSMSISNDECLLSYFDSAFFNQATIGLAFTNKGVHFTERFGSPMFYSYSNYNAFKCKVGDFDQHNVRDIMCDINEKIEAYKAEQYAIEKKQRTKKVIKEIAGVAAILFPGIRVAKEISMNKSDQLEEYETNDIFDSFN